MATGSVQTVVTEFGIRDISNEPSVMVIFPIDLMFSPSDILPLVLMISPVPLSLKSPVCTCFMILRDVSFSMTNTSFLLSLL